MLMGAFYVKIGKTCNCGSIISRLKEENPEDGNCIYHVDEKTEYIIISPKISNNQHIQNELKAKGCKFVKMLKPSANRRLACYANADMDVNETDLGNRTINQIFKTLETF